MWVSAQELNSSELNAFFNLVTKNATVRDVLTSSRGGIVYGPHVAVPLTMFSTSVQAAGLPLRQYPDLAHTDDCQFPMPGWHYAWTVTHGRQATNVLPRFSANIVGLRSNGSSPTIGVGAYSEGLNDDVNKAVWSVMAQDSSMTVEAAVAQYSNYHFGAELADAMAELIFSLEDNWAGDAGDNAAVLASLALAGQVEEAAPKSAVAGSWRLQSLLRRAYYDAYVQARLRAEVSFVSECYEYLAAAATIGSTEAVAQCSTSLQRNASDLDPRLDEWMAVVR